MTNLRPRQIVLLLALLLVALGLPRKAAAQVHLCNGGTRDGQDCATAGDCTPDGVCVINQGVCDGGTDDGLPCDCAGATCGATPVCTADTTLGTCKGGAFNGDCCDVASNCAGGRPCTGSQKVCIGGRNKGFSCLTSSQCPTSQCASSKKLCNGGDFDGFACVDDADCPGTAPTANGKCIGITVASPTPTRTRTPTQGTRTTTPTPTQTRPTPTRTTPTIIPTGGTITPTHVPTGVTPATTTPTPLPTAIPVTLTPTRTLVPGMARLAVAVASTDRSIALDNAKSFPDSGKIKIDNELITYSGKPRNGNVLAGAVRGAICSDAASHAAGAEVLDVTSRTIECRVEGKGGGCSINASDRASLPLTIVMGAFTAGLLRRRRGR